MFLLILLFLSAVLLLLVGGGLPYHSSFLAGISVARGQFGQLPIRPMRPTTEERTPLLACPKDHGRDRPWPVSALNVWTACFPRKDSWIFCVHGTDEANAVSVSCQAHLIVWHQLEAHGLQSSKDMHNVHLDSESLWIMCAYIYIYIVSYFYSIYIYIYIIMKYIVLYYIILYYFISYYIKLNYIMFVILYHNIGYYTISHYTIVYIVYIVCINKNHTYIYI